MHKELIKIANLLEKQAAFFTLKQILARAGVHVEHPVFHSTRFYDAASILHEGFKARAGGSYNDAYRDNSVCFTRNLCFSEKDYFGNGEVIFVLDLMKLKQHFKTYPYNWLSNVNKIDNKHPDKNENEERVSRSPMPVRDETEPETVIPPKYIIAVILKDERSSKRLAIYNEFKDKKVFVLRKGKDQYSLIQSEADIRSLADALNAQDYDLLKQLLDSGDDPNDFSKGYALRIAVSYHDTDIVKLLLDHGADPNANEHRTEWDDKTILEDAVERAVYNDSKIETVKLLLKHGAEYEHLLQKLTKEGSIGFEILLGLITPTQDLLENLLTHSLEANNFSDVKLLLKNYDLIATPEQLVAAVRTLDLSMVRLIFWGGVSESFSQSALNDALEIADNLVGEDMDDIVQLLISYGANPSVVGRPA